MTRDDIFRQLKAITVGKVKLRPEDIRPEMRILQDLGLDSLSIADLIIHTEEAFGFEFEEDDLQQLSTVESLLDLIQAKHTV